jgi:hypothetical protein
VDIRWRSHSPAYTPAQLRELLDAARRNPAVLAFPYSQRRELVGEEPTHCGRGHAYLQPGQRYRTVERGWLPCRCGGHVVYDCVGLPGRSAVPGPSDRPSPSLRLRRRLAPRYPRHRQRWPPKDDRRRVDTYVSSPPVITH